MRFLIDADSVVFKAGCANEFREYLIHEKGQVVASFPYKKDAEEYVASYPDDDLEIERSKSAGPFVHSVANAKSIMKKITDHPQCTDFRTFIGGPDNYRKELYAEYKANRDPFQRPIHEKKLRKYLIERWKAEIVTGEEVDDKVSYLTYGWDDDYVCLGNYDDEIPVIVSIDKDLDNTPGWHYNYDTDEMYFVDSEDADLNFYRQLLTGDSTDNIPGLHRVGKGTAKKILPEYTSPEEMCEVVWNEYKDRGHDEEYFLLNARLIWIRREENELWQSPIPLS